MGDMADLDIENGLMQDERDYYDEKTRKEMDKEFKMKHTKIPSKTLCDCGSDMIFVNRNGWVCIDDFFMALNKWCKENE